MIALYTQANSVFLFIFVSHCKIVSNTCQIRIKLAKRMFLRTN